MAPSGSRSEILTSGEVAAAAATPGLSPELVGSTFFLLADFGFCLLGFAIFPAGLAALEPDLRCQFLVAADGLRASGGGGGSAWDRVADMSRWAMARRRARMGSEVSAGGVVEGMPDAWSGKSEACIGGSMVVPSPFTSLGAAEAEVGVSLEGPSDRPA